MDFKQAFNEIRAVLAATGGPAPMAKPVKEEIQAGTTPDSTTMSLKDGTPVVVDKLAVGGNMLVDGLPAPDGEYVLADGTNVTTVNGVITELETASAEAAEPQEMKKFREDFTALQTEFAAFKTANETFATEFAAAKTTIANQDKAIQQLLSVVEQLAKIPVAEPVNKPDNFKAEKAEKKEDKLNNLTNTLKEIKKS